MRDVGERAAVHERRRALERLHQVRLQRILQERAHGALSVQVVRGDGRVIVGVAHYDAAQALLQIGDAGRQAEDGHHLAGHRYVEAVLARHAVGLAAQTVHDMAQLAVVHIHHALPGYLAHVYAQLVAVLDMRIEQRRQQVVRSAYGVEVAGEMQVDILHRHHLGVSAARRAALDAEHRPQRRLAQRYHHILAPQRQRVGQAHRGSGLALASRRGVDGRHQHQLARLVVFLTQQVVVHFRLAVAVQLEVLAIYPASVRYVGDGLRLCCLGYLDVSEHAVLLAAVDVRS